MEEEGKEEGKKGKEGKMNEEKEGSWDGERREFGFQWLGFI